jgi:hypothetical protein
MEGNLMDFIHFSTPLECESCAIRAQCTASDRHTLTNDGMKKCEYYKAVRR